MTKIFIGTGGTGGHIYPALALAETLLEKEHSWEATFIGARQALEAEIFKQSKFKYFLITSRGILRKISFQAFSAPFFMLKGFFEALALLYKEKPQVILSFGGFASAPLNIAGIILRIPLILHEQNAVLGASNRFFALFCQKLLTSFPETQYAPKNKTIFCGVPVRKSIENAHAIGNKKQKTLLIMGGSQGARALNLFIKNNLSCLETINMEVIHLIGKRDFEQISFPTEKYPFYHPFSYMNDIEKVLAKSDIIISRAGASALAEIFCLGKPSILVPFPYAAENHQLQNALFAQKHGAAIVIEEKDLSWENLLAGIKAIEKDWGVFSQQAKKLYPQNSQEKIIAVIKEILNHAKN